MSDFYTLLDEYIGVSSDVSDIRVTVRRCWFYDFDGYPVRIWQGQGKLHTSDGQEWLGSIDANGVDHHKTPAIADGRDGTSASYVFTLLINDYPGQTAGEMYEALKAEQWRVSGRSMVCYMVLFEENEGLRPATPITFFKDLTMVSPKFSEKIELIEGGLMVRRYSASVVGKDGNFGRSNVPGGSYADTIQKARAKEQGVALDRGCEFLAKLANRTYQLP